MNRLSMVIAFVMMGAFPCLTRAEDKGADEATKVMSKIAQLGPGVHAIKKDKQGRIASCVVVGQSRISTVLGKSKGLEVARQRADLDAKAQFVRWLKESVSVHTKTDDETILFLEGSEENDKDALRKSGKAVEKTSKRMETVAQGLVRGLQVLHVEMSKEDKTYTLVMGWEAQTAEATKRVKKINDTEAVGGGKKEDLAPDTSTTPKRSGEEKIEDKKVTSPDAKKFLP